MDALIPCPFPCPPSGQPQEARSEAPALDPALRSRLLAAAERASASERFGDLFAAAPECHEAYESVNERFEFYNRLVGAPSLISNLDECTAGLDQMGLRIDWWGSAAGWRGGMALLHPPPSPPTPTPTLAHTPFRLQFSGRTTLAFHTRSSRPRQVALPLSLSEIIERLRAGYYHQREAVARDIQVGGMGHARARGSGNEWGHSFILLCSMHCTGQNKRLRGCM